MNEQEVSPPYADASVAKKKAFGAIGIAIGLLALSAAFLSPWIQAAIDPPPPPIEQAAVDLAGRLAEAAKAKLTGEDYVAAPASTPKPSRFLVPAVIGSGMVAVGFGLFSLLRAEPRVVGGAAIALGVSAAVVQWSIIIATVLIVVLLVAAILSAVGVDL